MIAVWNFGLTSFESSGLHAVAARPLCVRWNLGRALLTRSLPQPKDVRPQEDCLKTEGTDVLRPLECGLRRSIGWEPPPGESRLCHLELERCNLSSRAWWIAGMLALGLHSVVCAPRCRELHLLVKVWRLDMHDLRRCILQRAWFDQTGEELYPWIPSLISNRNDCMGRCGLPMHFVGLDDETSGLRATSLDSETCLQTLWEQVIRGKGLSSMWLANWGIWGSRTRIKFGPVWTVGMLCFSWKWRNLQVASDLLRVAPNYRPCVRPAGIVWSCFTGKKIDREPTPSWACFGRTWQLQSAWVEVMPSVTFIETGSC